MCQDFKMLDDLDFWPFDLQWYSELHLLTNFIFSKVLLFASLATMWNICHSLSRITVLHWRRQLWGTGARDPLDLQLFNCSGHFTAAQTLTMDSIWLSTEKRIYMLIALSLFCMNFIIFWCVTLKLFSSSFVPVFRSHPRTKSRRRQCVCSPASGGWKAVSVYFHAVSAQFTFTLIDVEQHGITIHYQWRRQ